LSSLNIWNIQEIKNKFLYSLCHFHQLLQCFFHDSLISTWSNLLKIECNVPRIKRLGNFLWRFIAICQVILNDDLIVWTKQILKIKGVFTHIMSIKSPPYFSGFYQLRYNLCEIICKFSKLKGFLPILLCHQKSSILFRILPTKVQFVACQYLGVNNFMDNFTGRSTKIE